MTTKANGEKAFWDQQSNNIVLFLGCGKGEYSVVNGKFFP